MTFECIFHEYNQILFYAICHISKLGAFLKLSNFREKIENLVDQNR